MTMDIANETRGEIKIPSPRIADDTSQTKCENLINKKSTGTKRSFDVAFLMLPDEKLKNNNEKHPRLTINPEIMYPSLNGKMDYMRHHQTEIEQVKPIENARNPSPSRYFLQNGIHFQHIDHMNQEVLRNLRYPHLQSLRSPRIYDDPTILPMLDRLEREKLQNGDMESHKSAFTKVPHQGRLDSPAPPLSPDQMSCPSISPPASSSPPRYNSFRQEYSMSNGHFQTISHAQEMASHHSSKLKQQLIYRHSQNGNSMNPIDIPPGYLPPSGFPFNPQGHPFATSQPEMVRNPAAAAILSTLIPPTLATTFTLTAQNVCAKCNISFRMTSDLVYHMRSHHKSETTVDPNRRKREEKLKCPVCNESFRERHHLTRHMTAHQDKESDDTEPAHLQRRHK